MNENRITELAKAIAGITDTNQRATVLAAVTEALTDSETESETLSKADRLRFDLGREIAKAFNRRAAR